MVQNVIEFSEQNQMIEKGDRIVVGLSGGADSVCLLHVLLKFYKKNIDKIVAVHINHGLRGKQADQDELFVKELCKSIGIECYSVHKDVREIARENKLSEEEAGRNVRYDEFFQACQRYKCNKIAIAHNRNDNAETMLFNLFRGSGINGLTGIDPKRKMEKDKDEALIIRPLLNTGRDEIEDYLKERNISYIVDKSNLENDYSRNKIRNQVLTLITDEINPNAIGNIANATFHLREIQDFLNEGIKVAYDDVLCEADGVFVLPFNKMSEKHVYIQKSIIMEVMARLSGSRRNLESKHVEQVIGLFHKQVGRQVDLPRGIVALRGYNDISIYNKSRLYPNKEEQSESVKSIAAKIPGSNYLPQLNKIMKAELINKSKDETFPKNSCIKWFNYDRIENTVEIRTREAGDYIQINAEGGRKKLKDYFIDLKLPASQRSKQLLLADGNHIMWIIGDDSRISEKYKIDNNTEKILVMELIDAKEKSNGR